MDWSEAKEADTEYGKEKQESLSGITSRCRIGDLHRWTDMVFSGLNDKEIEDSVTGLVKTGI